MQSFPLRISEKLRALVRFDVLVPLCDQAIQFQDAIFKDQP